MSSEPCISAGEVRKVVQWWMQQDVLDHHLPEVAALRDIPQPEDYHSEGDAFVHTMLALEAVTDDADPRVFWAVLLHDIGKAGTTEFVKGRWRSHGHAEAGAAMVPAILERIGLPGMKDDVEWLVRHHTFHFSWNLDHDFRITRNRRKLMEHPLFPLLLQVCSADAAGSLGRSEKGDKIRLIAEMYQNSGVP